MLLNPGGGGSPPRPGPAQPRARAPPPGLSNMLDPKYKNLKEIYPNPMLLIRGEEWVMFDNSLELLSVAQTAVQ